jgi:hypothetical protein
LQEAHDNGDDLQGRSLESLKENGRSDNGGGGEEDIVGGGDQGGVEEIERFLQYC